ncbi:hypothetical protein BSL78_07885 [Apostichopus japonicus]|uniref:Uncharacterized protein n=1 Tax=Stichopus japonicus TaxID=307972 RepID=A0A2G8L4M0_STIJA|nr:hypothetical protein BSL78_07885 [Apostichopus japonicus]
MDKKTKGQEDTWTIRQSGETKGQEDTWTRRQSGETRDRKTHGQEDKAESKGQEDTWTRRQSGETRDRKTHGQEDKEERQGTGRHMDKKTKRRDKGQEDTWTRRQSGETRDRKTHGQEDKAERQGTGRHMDKKTKRRDKGQEDTWTRRQRGETRDRKTHGQEDKEERQGQEDTWTRRQRGDKDRKTHGQEDKERQGTGRHVDNKTKGQEAMLKDMYEINLPGQRLKRATIRQTYRQLHRQTHRLEGELHSMDHLKLSSHCIVGLQHPGDLAINITHLDVKTFGSLLINDWIAGSTSLTGTTLNVRSGGTIRASNLGLHYTNVSLEPAAFLNVQFDPEAQYQIGKDLGYGVGSTSGSSGAGHGGNGGQGSSQKTVGTSYGNFAMPTDPGGFSRSPTLEVAAVGVSGFKQNTLTATVHWTLVAVVGMVVRRWGWRLCCYLLHDNHYSGDFFTAGGLSSYEPGGSGTVYLHQLQVINGTQLLDATSPEGRIHHESNVTSPLTNRTLYMNSRGRMPRVALRNLTDYYEDVSNVGAMTWLEPSEVAPIVRERNTPSHYYEDHIIIDELHVYGGAEIGFVRPSQPRDELNIRLGTITGDYTARMMVGFNQTLYVSKAHFPLNVDIYRGGRSSLYGELDIKKITFNVEGVLTNVWNMTITQGKESRTGTLNMHEMVDTEGNSTPDFYFHSIVVRNLGTFYTHHGTGTRFIQGNNLQVFGGGLLTSSNLHIDAGEVIVDKKGLITVTGQGHAANEGPGGGITSGGYGSGGTHGGEGGCRSASHESPPAYGSVTHPMEFGSGAGAVVALGRNVAAGHRQAGSRAV